jgi:flagellar basal body-associated protein FliL
MKGTTLNFSARSSHARQRRSFSLPHCLLALLFGLVLSAESQSAGGGGGSTISPFFQLEQIVVNLAPPDVSRYVQINLAIETSDPKSAQMLKDYTPIIRSRTIIILSSKSLAELKTQEGKFKLSGEILEMARMSIPHSSKDPTNGLMDIHITGLMIQ